MAKSAQNHGDWASNQFLRTRKCEKNPRPRSCNSLMPAFHKIPVAGLGTFNLFLGQRRHVRVVSLFEVAIDPLKRKSIRFRLLAFIFLTGDLVRWPVLLYGVDGFVQTCKHTNMKYLTMGSASFMPGDGAMCSDKKISSQLSRRALLIRKASRCSALM